MHPAAAALIQQSHSARLPELSEDHIKFLSDLLEHNDATKGNRPRVGAKKAIEGLESLGVKIGDLVFNKLIHHHFGRTWSGRTAK